MKPLYLRSIVVMVLVLLSGTTFAKTVYVNDQIRVGLRPEPNNDAAPLTVVATGDKLELLDKDSGYVLVRTAEGTEGWIKEIYTTATVPAIVQLRSLNQKAGGTDVKLQELNKQITLMESANKVLTEELEEVKNEKSKYQLQLMALKSGQGGSGWFFWLGGIVVFTIASFILGMYWYRNQAMKRLGGLRIYF
ncbi:MAG: TIGR04211 family SH3 domain-containing protein [Gammaproteobacteria bacterium]|nr:TIGR04211 family SH3 domain-containing protein [Gammaproteobacteria bacterium]